MNINLTGSTSFLKANANRRSFLRKSLGFGAGAAVLPAAMSLAPRQANAAEDPAALAQDLSVLTLALNLEYLEAEYYTRAQFGDGMENHDVGTDGKTTTGPVTIKADPKVQFSNPAIGQYLAETAQDERNHVNFLRSVFFSLGLVPPSKPAIDLQNSFNTAAAVAGISTTGFDPFANDLNFLLGSFIFEDVGVTAYHGGAPLLTNPDYLSAAAGILAVEAIHAATVRTLIFLAGADAVGIAAKISDLRDSLDGKSDKDQTLSDPAGRPEFPVNIVPSDANALVFDRNTKKVLNIVYGAKNVSGGLFFPEGINV